ncbi:hypothetical protein [Haloplanus rubicundus]|nr:hypothetical protein [Haloplanus rubicundus]
MARTELRIAAVALLLLVAGCAALGPGGSGTQTPTETAASTATGTPTPTETAAPTATGTPTDADRARYPDGWSAAGIDDPDAALAAHYRATLAGPSVTVTYRSRIRESTNDRGANTTLAMRVDTASERLYADLDGSDTHREAFFADGTLTQWSVENETVADRSGTTFSRAARSIDRSVLYSHLLLYTLERTGSVERSGTTALVYNVTGVPDSTVSNTYGTATGASGRVVVGRDGRVFDVETTVTYTGGTVTYHYGHAAVGETAVERPGWMDEA